LNLDVQYDDGFVAYLNGVGGAPQRPRTAMEFNRDGRPRGVFDTLSYADFANGV
jgi:hypothetical protein